ncbi:MAG: ion transporter, partial [bacterium]
MTLIALNVLAMVLETVDAVQRVMATFFWWFEAVSVAIFTVEYGLRVWSCTAASRYGAAGPVVGRLRFMLTPLALVDLLAILPFYLTMFGDLRVLRVLRL